MDFDEEDQSPELLKQAEEETDRRLAEGDPENIYSQQYRKNIRGTRKHRKQLQYQLPANLSKHRGFADISKWRKWERKISWFKKRICIWFQKNGKEKLAFLQKQPILGTLLQA